MAQIDAVETDYMSNAEFPHYFRICPAAVAEMRMHNGGLNLPNNILKERLISAVVIPEPQTASEFSKETRRLRRSF
jgi:hypothetical protein